MPRVEGAGSGGGAMVLLVGCSTTCGAVLLVNGGVDGSGGVVVAGVLAGSLDATPMGRSVLYCWLVVRVGIFVGSNEGGVCDASG